MGAESTQSKMISIIVPTWQRHGMLLDRCLPSLRKQDYPAIEVLVISDGPDPELAAKLAQPWLNGWRDLWYAQLAEHAPERHYGHYARAYGCEIAEGDYITYCDDDDMLRPQHCSLLARALDDNPGAGFAVARMLSHSPQGDSEIGVGPPACGNLGTPMLCHRRELLDIATWDHASQFEDWELAWTWIQAGIKYIQVPEITSDVWPSVFR
jgi:glycosyltransferase involved in cell wall biosynthesis